MDVARTQPLVVQPVIIRESIPMLVRVACRCVPKKPEGYFFITMMSPGVFPKRGSISTHLLPTFNQLRAGTFFPQTPEYWRCSGEAQAGKKTGICFWCATAIGSLQDSTTRSRSPPRGQAGSV